MFYRLVLATTLLLAVHGRSRPYFDPTQPAVNVTCDRESLNKTANDLANDMRTSAAWCIKEALKPSSKHEILPEDCCPSLQLLDQGACICEEVLDSLRHTRVVQETGSAGFRLALFEWCNMTASDLNDCSSVATVSPTAAPTADPSTAAPSATPTATPSLPTFSPTSVGVEMAADPSTKKPSATATPTYVLDPTADFGYAMSDSFSDTDLDLSQSDFSDTDIDDLSESDRLAYDLAEGFSRRRLLQAAECEQNATALLAERLANVQKLTGLIFSNVTEFRSNLTSLTSALADVLHPNAYLVVYPLGKFSGMEDIAEAVLLLFRPTVNRQWATLERNNSSVSLIVSNASSSGENVMEIADYVKAGTAIMQTLPDLLEETAEGTVPEDPASGVLHQRLQFTPCSSLIDSVTMDLPVGMSQRLLDSISPEEVSCAAAIDACFLAALPDGGSPGARMHWALTDGTFVQPASSVGASVFTREVFERAVDTCVPAAERYPPADSKCEYSEAYSENAAGKTEMKQGRTASCDFLNSLLAQINPTKYCMRYMTDHGVNPIGVGYGTYGFVNQRSMCYQCYVEYLD